MGEMGLKLVPKLWLGNPPAWKLQLRRTCGYHPILKTHGKLELGNERNLRHLGLRVTELTEPYYRRVCASSRNPISPSPCPRVPVLFTFRSSKNPRTLLQRSRESEHESMVIHNHHFTASGGLVKTVIARDQGVPHQHSPIDRYRSAIDKNSDLLVHWLTKTIRFSRSGWTGECFSR